MSETMDLGFINRALAEQLYAERAANAPAPTPANIRRLADLSPADALRFAHMIRSDANPRGTDPNALLPMPTGWHMMVLQYVRPENTRTSGGIMLPAQTLKEDEYQGRVGLVLALGPDAYADKSRYPGGAWVQPGDWIAWPRLAEASARVAFGALTLAILADEKVLMKGVDPDAALAR